MPFCAVAESFSILVVGCGLWMRLWIVFIHNPQRGVVEAFTGACKMWCSGYGITITITHNPQPTLPPPPYPHENITLAAKKLVGVGVAVRQVFAPVCALSILAGRGWVVGLREDCEKIAECCGNGRYLRVFIVYPSRGGGCNNPYAHFFAAFPPRGYLYFLGVIGGFGGVCGGVGMGGVVGVGAAAGARSGEGAPAYVCTPNRPRRTAAPLWRVRGISPAILPIFPVSRSCTPPCSSGVIPGGMGARHIHGGSARLDAFTPPPKGSDG